MYVHNDFVSPGRHTYFVFIPDASGNIQFRKHFECLVKARKETISYKSLPKASQGNVVSRTVHKSQYPELIRNQWKLDVGVMEQEVIRDKENLNISKLMKPEEMEKVQDILISNSKYLYMLFRNLSSGCASFPKISAQTLLNFFSEINIMGPKFPEKEFLRVLAMIAAEAAPGQEKKIKKLDKTYLLSFELGRHQFLEAIVRVAVERYREAKIGASEALSTILTECFEEHCKEEEVCADFPFIANEVYQGQVNDIIYVNQSNLMTVYEKFKTESPREGFEISDAIKMLEGVVPGQESEIRKSFNRAKEVKESQPGDEQDWKQLSHLEFLVFLCYTAKKIFVVKQKHAKIQLDELVSNLIQKLCLKYDLQMDFPDVPLHDLYQNLSEDSDYKFDPLAKEGEEVVAAEASPKKKKGKG